jgi:RNA-directed DNA polymerase
MKLGSMTKKRKVFIEEWKSLPWKEFAKTLFHLQHRLYKASKEKDIERCKKLQSLILGSSCSRYLAVRQVTQLKMCDELKSIKNWIHQPLRRVFIQNLGIRTIRDRAMQCLIKYALEPYYEANASNGSLRIGEIQKNILMNLNQKANGHTKMILKFDIEKSFDTIDHDKLLSLVVLPTSAKEIIRSSLKARVLDVISSLLWKIVLNGIENLNNQRGLKYADKMIFFLKPGEDSVRLRLKLDQFLAQRGLKLKESKTQLVKSTDGFNFLGWHFKVKLKNHKFVSYPSKNNRSAVIKEIKSKLRDTRLPFGERLSKVKIIYRGWRNYHKYCDLSKLNLWPISNWVYRFGKKRTSMNKDILLKEVKDTFNVHS